MVTGDEPRPSLPSAAERFQHPAEQQFAEILDFYKVRWEYEPTTFVLATDATGRTTEAFAPDFYLPDHDLYIEVTTMDQRLVRRKNRKLRRLRERYPDVSCKILYQRDMKALAQRFGIEPGIGT
ncbi:MAG: hypothetical protein U0U69_00220 [Acidimicrobiia bacterium]